MRTTESALSGSGGPGASGAAPSLHIDLRGLVSYARQKGVSVPDLSDKEKNRFITGGDMNTVRKLAARNREDMP